MCGETIVQMLHAFLLHPQLPNFSHLDTFSLSTQTATAVLVERHVGQNPHFIMMSHPLVYCWYFSMDYDRVHQVVLVACPSSYVWLTPINVHVCDVMYCLCVNGVGFFWRKVYTRAFQCSNPVTVVSLSKQLLYHRVSEGFMITTM